MDETVPDFETTTRSPEETEGLGRRLGEGAAPGLVLELQGPLGAGKTRFVWGLARGLGILEGIRSPTFTICHVHPGRVPLYHLDAYRIEDPAELLAQGWDDMCQHGVVAVEWGERLGSLLPRERVTIVFSHVGESRRRLEFRAVGKVARAQVGDLSEG